MQHVFFRGEPDAPTLVLLHGTGGTENDLVSLGRRIDGRANLLGLRGEVLENGGSRYFRRLAVGVFDIDDMVARTAHIHGFLAEFARAEGLDRQNFWAVGYSNGANLAGSLMLHHAHALRGALLFHPVVPRRDVAWPDLTGVSVFIGAGTNDPMCPTTETQELQTLLNGAGADVHVHWEDQGHRLNSAETVAAVAWYQGL